jgi:hypothetical protein
MTGPNPRGDTPAGAILAELVIRTARKHDPALRRHPGGCGGERRLVTFDDTADSDGKGWQ